MRLRQNLPNSIDRSVNMRELVARRWEEREKRLRKKDRTGQPEITSEVNKHVRLQNLQSKRWDVKGVVKDVRISEKGTILSYEIVLPNNHISTRHRRFIRKEILPENPVEFSPQSDGTNIPDTARLEGRSWSPNHGLFVF